MSVYSVDGSEIQEIFDVQEAELDVAYDINGEVVFRRGTPSHDYDNYTITNMFTYSQSNMQSFAVYDGKIAQVKQTDAIHIIDIETGNFVKSVSMDTGHGNSSQFSNVFYDESDEFPLFYVRNDGVWVYRIVGNTSTLIKKYAFSADVIGTYVAGFGIDNTNQRFYTVSYTEGDYITKTGQLRMCVWDMASETDNNDGTFSFDFITSQDSVWFDTHEAVQGCCYHDGFLFVANGYGTGNQYVTLFSVNTLEITHEISTTGAEIEGCAWVDDDYLVIGQGPSTIAYRKVEFS